MTKIETITKWLKDSAGKIVVPKTLTSCVLDSNGKTVDERLEECENGNISIRYNSETDYVQLKIGGEWKDYIRAFALFKPLECKFIKINFTKLNSNSPNYVSLKEIIETIGYSSKSFFYKKFKHYYGMTPAEMRKRLFREAHINLK